MLWNYMTEIMLAVFFFITVLAAYLVYRSFTTEDIRKLNQQRIRKILINRRTTAVQKKEDSKLERMLKEAGNPLGLNAHRFGMIRLAITAFLLIYYVIIPFSTTRIIPTIPLICVVLFILLTSADLRFSLTSIILSRVIKYRIAKLNSELFMLYDMIRSELSNLNEHQEVNTYNLLMDMTGYFSYIDRPLKKMLIKWKSGAQVAGEEFYAAIPTSEARSLIDILVKMDRTRCADALILIQGLAESFTEAYVENMKRKKEALDLVLNIPVFGTQWLIVANLLIVMFLMISDLIEYTNVPLS